MPRPDPARHPPEKGHFAIRNTLPPPWPAAGGRGQGWLGGWWLVAGWLGGWVAGWLVAGGWWLLAGWLGKGKVIGFDYYVMS